jgi:hypothetical protein
MISKVAKVKSSSAFNIKTLNEYLRLGHKDDPKMENERVKSFFTLNMYSADLETATQEMMYTASLNTRSKCSKYMHLVLSLSEGESLTDEQWKLVAKDYLKEVNMTDHQAIAVRHGDNGKDHLHLIINRIDTNTHARTNDYQLYRKLQKFDEEIEKKYNLKQFDHKADTTHDFQQSALNRAKDVEKKTEHQSLLTYLLEHKEEIKKSATSWKDLQKKLLEFDCQIVVKGRGLVIKSLNKEHLSEVKASSFDRDFSYSKLIKKFGLPPSDLNNEPTEQEKEKVKQVKSYVAIPLTKKAKRIEYTAYFFKKIESRGDKILDKGDKFIVKKLDSPDTVRDLLKISKKRFGNGNIRVNGDRNFQRRVMFHALKMNIDIKLSDPVLQREYDLKWSRLKFEEKNRALVAQEKIKYNSLLELQLEQKRKEYERQNRRNQQHTKSERDQSEKTRNSGRSI